MPRKTKFKVELGNRIKLLRKSLGMTQEELGSKIGVKKTTITNYESGYSEPESERLKQLSYIFNVSIDYLLGDEKPSLYNVTNSLTHKTKNNICTAPIFISENGKLLQTTQDIMLPNEIETGKNYFAFKTSDESMSPLLGINDVAIIEKTDKFSDTNTCLISLDNNTIFIRKILDLKTHIELQPINYNFDTIKLTKDDMEKRNFQILGKVVKVENLSAFK